MVEKWLDTAVLAVLAKVPRLWKSGKDLYIHSNVEYTRAHVTVPRIKRVKLTFPIPFTSSIYGTTSMILYNMYKTNNVTVIYLRGTGIDSKSEYAKSLQSYL